MNRSELHRITVSASKSLGIGFYCFHSVSLAEVTCDYLSTIPYLFETIDGYQYVAKRTRSGSRYMYCSQYRHHFKDKEDVLKNTISVLQSKQRNVSKKRVHQYGGFLSIGVKKKEFVTVQVGHKVNHESASDRYELSP